MAEASELLEIKQRLALLETRVQQLFEHLDVTPRESPAGADSGWWGASGEGGPPPDAASDPEIQDLVAKGNEVQAIKRYRELTGAGLREAKKAIEQLKG